MKVALALCPSWDARFSPCALPSLAAGLQTRGHQAAIFDLNQAYLALESCACEPRKSPGNLTSQWCEPSFVLRQFEDWQGYLEGLAGRILDEGFRAIGFSVFFSNALMSLEVARLFKRKDPGMRVIFGGPQCLNYARSLELVRNDCLDAVVYGEGDLALPALIDAWERGRRPEAPGILLPSDETTWRDRPAEAADLDALPFADYTAHRLGLRRPKVINTCRGCVRRCDFCSDWRQMKLRQRRADRTHRDLRHQLEAHPGLRSFAFGDSLINAVPAEFDGLCRRLIEEPLDLSWGGYAIIRPEMTPRALENARQAGCRSLLYGIESGSERIRERIKKNPPLPVIEAVLRDTVAAGIDTTVTLIAGHPCETEDDFQETLSFVRRNARAISGINVALFQAWEMEGYQDEYGLDLAAGPWFWRAQGGENTFPTRLRRVRRLASLARDLGIPTVFDNSVGADIERRCGEYLDHFRRRPRLMLS